MFKLHTFKGNLTKENCPSKVNGLNDIIIYFKINLSNFRYMQNCHNNYIFYKF